MVADSTRPEEGETPWCGSVHDTATGELRFRFGEGFTAESHNMALRVGRDRDGDGVDEILVAARGSFAGDSGRGLLVVSGKTGGILSFTPLDGASTRYRGLRVVDELVSLSGETHVALRGPKVSWRARTGWIVSLDRGKAWELPRDHVPLGDLERRGVCDLVRLDTRDEPVEVVDGLTLEPKFALRPGGRSTSVRTIEDTDGDAVRDILLLRTYTLTDDDDVMGVLTVLSGVSGREILRCATKTCFETFVFEAQQVGDFNGDGVRDFAMSAWHMIGCEPVRILCGRTGEDLHRIEQGSFASHPHISDFLGTGFVAERDVNGDDVLDVWIGTGYWKAPGLQSGVGLFSGATGKHLRTINRPE